MISWQVYAYFTNLKIGICSFGTFLWIKEQPLYTESSVTFSESMRREPRIICLTSFSDFPFLCAHRFGMFLSLPLILGIGPPRCEWQGPSDHFSNLDRDQNQELSLDEWMAYYGSHTHD